MYVQPILEFIERYDLPERLKLDPEEVFDIFHGVILTFMVKGAETAAQWIVFHLNMTASGKFLESGKEEYDVEEMYELEEELIEVLKRSDEDPDKKTPPRREDFKSLKPHTPAG